MQNLIPSAGKYRNKGVRIVKGTEIEHIAPPFQNVTSLMKELFTYLKSHKELILIKSYVFHYEVEFTHPFIGSNGRMGRFW